MVSITSIAEKIEHIFLKNFLKVAVYWNATSSTLPEIQQHSRRICCLQHQCM
jgi:uncharacterized membrane protein